MVQSTSARAAVVKRILTENLARIRERIAESAQKVGRDPARVQLVAVTKSVSPEVIRALLELGQADLGESQVQQLVQRAGILQEQMHRRSMLDSDTAAATPRWHMIGHLQRNKVKPLLPLVAVIHSLDTLRLAEEISSYGHKIGKVQDVLVEVNCSGEAQKFGLPVAAVGHLIEQISSLPNLAIRGLMTMAPQVKDPEAARPVFDRLYELFLELKMDYRLGHPFQDLSMGMSQDYAVAVECGATMVRVGTALFEGIEGV